MSTEEKKDHLIKDSLLLFVASSVVNLSNFVFHMFATRGLKPEEYGTLATLLGMIMIFTMPAASLQMTVVKKTAALKARGLMGSVEYLFKRATLWFFVIAVAAFFMLYACSKLIGDFFHMPDNVLVLILGGIIVISFVLPVVRGVLQGLQEFTSLGANMIVDALLRLGFLLLFMKLGLGVRGVLSTTMFSAFCAYILGIVMIWRIFRYKEGPVQIIRKRELFGYAVPVLVAYLGFSLLSYMDLFMVKHFFNEQQAGYYAVTSIIGKAFLFFPGAIIMALFPKVSEHVELNRNPAPMLLKSLGLTLGFSFLGIVFCYFFPEFVLRVLTGGDKYAAITGVVRIFGAAILPLVMFNVILNYSLASHRYGFIYFLYAGLALYAGLLWFFHSSFYSVLGVMFGVNLAVLILGLLWILNETRKAANQ